MAWELDVRGRMLALIVSVLDLRSRSPLKCLASCAGSALMLYDIGWGDSK